MGLTRRQWMAIAVIMVGTFVTVLNQTLVAPALPSIMKDTSVDAATAQWLTTGFTLVNAIMIPITAYLQDRFTTKRLFLFSMLVFLVGALLCGLAANFPLLLAGRIVQAIGAGILMPMSMTVLLVTFPVEKRGAAMGIFGLVVAFAPAIGPTVGGIVVDTADWHIMFLGIAVLSAITLVLAAILMVLAGCYNVSLPWALPGSLCSRVRLLWWVAFAWCGSSSAKRIWKRPCCG